eukprot:6197660-Pleurochrysis_carterae.AAC.1
MAGNSSQDAGNTKQRSMASLTHENSLDLARKGNALPLERVKERKFPQQQAEENSLACERVRIRHNAFKCFWHRAAQPVLSLKLAQKASWLEPRPCTLSAHCSPRAIMPKSCCIWLESYD